MEPAKHSTVSDATAGFATTHNTVYQSSPTQNITQGDGNINRDGDEIYLESIKLRIACLSQAATGAYSFRILVGYSGEETSCPTTFVSVLGTSSFFLPTTGGVYGHNAIVNPKAFTVLDDRTVTLNSIIAATNEIQNEIYTVPLKQKFQYRASASVYGKTKNLYIVVVTTVNGGTTGTTATGAVYVNSDLIFKAI